ncbi:hypothetical protein NC653_028064 [Populus alba x Populus x berolinensis]|uniref:Uncharacterized protein n=1 Tax=Populus alba x Populus x berolinensis TaxID=444605 RepID=A0AAD6Q7M7_9ROSI|nr:hypothetical protein NC653_028064 [Populus alba x Populus x berolinensis]
MNSNENPHNDIDLLILALERCHIDPPFNRVVMDDVGIGDIVPPPVSSSSEIQEGDHATDLQSGGDDNRNNEVAEVEQEINLEQSAGDVHEEDIEPLNSVVLGSSNSNEFHGFMGFGRNLGHGFHRFMGFGRNLVHGNGHGYVAFSLKLNSLPCHGHNSTGICHVSGFL